MRTVLLVGLAALTLGAKGHAKKAEACPFVGTADIDSSGAVQNLIGLSPRTGAMVQAFDIDGALGKLRVSGSGDLHFAGGTPGKVKASTFTHALLVDASVGSLHVAEPDKDLPQGVFAEAVQIYLADHKGGRVALISVPGQTEDDTCSEIDCKVNGAWKKCWSDCK